MKVGNKVLHKALNKEGIITKIDKKDRFTYISVRLHNSVKPITYGKTTFDALFSLQ